MQGIPQAPPFKPSIARKPAIPTTSITNYSNRESTAKKKISVLTVSRSAKKLPVTKSPVIKTFKPDTSKPLEANQQQTP